MGDLKRWAQTAGHDAVSGKNLFLRIRKQAAKNVTRDFFNRQKDIELDELKFSEIDGEFDVETIITGSVTTKTIKKNNSDPYVTAFVEYVEFWAKNSGSGQLTIGTGSDTPEVIPINVIEGYNKLPVRYQGDLITLDLDITGIEIRKVKESPRSGNLKYDYYSSDTGCKVCKCSGSYYTIENSTENVEFRVAVSSICSEQSIICQYAHKLSDAMAWQCMALLMEHGKRKDDKSRLIRNSRDEAAGYYADIMGGDDPQTGYKVKRPKYWIELSSAIKRINLKPSRCLQCRGGLSYREVF